MIEFKTVAFDAPESVELIEAVQQEYVVRYGSRDASHIEADQFAPPQGIFVVGWHVDHPVACGGVRVVEDGIAELKRMYVAPSVRRRGFARALLGRLETEAHALGAAVLRLETGLNQPEAIGLYESSGYTKTEPFGYYADAPLARHFAKQLPGS